MAANFVCPVGQVGLLKSLECRGEKEMKQGRLGHRQLLETVSSNTILAVGVLFWSFLRQLQEDEE